MHNVTARQIVAIVIALAVSAVSGAANGTGDDVQKLVGTVLMLTPSDLKVGTDAGEIEELAILEGSEIGQHIVEGDRVEVWYRHGEGQSKVVVRTARNGETGSEATVSRRHAEAEPSQPSSEQRSATGSAEPQAGQAGSAGGKDEPSYDEVVGDPEMVMITDPQRPVLPQTGSNLPAIGLTGVIALFIAGALSVLAVLSARRSGS